MRFLSIFCFYFLCTVSSASNSDLLSCRTSHCIAVVDAGSTGSRLHVYQYRLDKNKNPVEIQSVFAKKITPGLATLSLNPEVTNLYLSSLFKGLTTDSIPVFFYATAGMRLLSQPDQKKHYDLVRSWFKSQPQLELRDLKTITGIEEGAYVWLAVNYQDGRLQNTNKPLAGVMDMGGASVQVAIPLDKDSEVTGPNVLSINRYGRSVKIYVNSFLGAGLTEVMHHFLDTSSCFSAGYLMPNQKAAEGNLYDCMARVKPLIDEVHHIDKVIKPIFHDSQVESWYVVGGLGYLAQSPLFHFSDSRFTIAQLSQQADEALCRGSWEKLYADYPTNKYLFGECFSSAYYSSLLLDGYGLSENQVIHYFNANEKSDDWTLGVVLQPH